MTGYFKSTYGEDILFENYPDILFADQLCDMLSISKSTMYRLVNTGEIGYYQIRGRKAYRKADVIRYLEDSYTTNNDAIEMIE